MRTIEPICGRLFSMGEAAQFMGITRSKVKKLVSSGALPAVRHASGRIDGIYESDAKAWIEKNRTTAAAPAPSIDDQVAQLLPPKHERSFAHA